MDHFPPHYFFDLSSYQHAALFEKCIHVWDSLKNIENYLSALSLGSIAVDIPQGAFLVNPHLITISKGTVVEPGAYIKGPCYIGENCTIRHGAYIRGNFIAGKDCVIGHDTEIKQAIFLDGAQAPHFAYVGDSILGNRVNLGAGTKCANLKLDHRPITVEAETHRIDTHLRKFGAIFGDETQIGCNVVTHPGTLFGKQVFCYPCLSVGGFIPSQSIVKNEQHLVIKPRAKFER